MTDRSREEVSDPSRRLTGRGSGGSIEERVAQLAAEATAAREQFEPPADPPDRDRAHTLLREGFGPTVWVYVEAHTSGRNHRFTPAELASLQGTMNDWLELYARCYGVDLEAAFTVRKAAELLLETHNVYDAAQLLTRVPER